MIHSHIATEKDKEQALREALSQRDTDTTAFVLSDKFRREETAVRQHYVGFLGEIVACREWQWTRTEPDSAFDATDKDRQKIEIKTRAKWFADLSKGYIAMVIPTHPLHLCDWAYLFHYYVDTDKNARIGLIRRYDRDHLQRFQWQIVIPLEFWNESLNAGKNRVPQNQSELQAEEWKKVRERLNF